MSGKSYRTYSCIVPYYLSNIVTYTHVYIYIFKATAVTFFKRFFLYQTLMDYDPQKMMYALDPTLF